MQAHHSAATLQILLAAIGKGADQTVAAGPVAAFAEVMEGEAKTPARPGLQANNATPRDPSAPVIGAFLASTEFQTVAPVEEPGALVVALAVPVADTGASADKGLAEPIDSVSGAGGGNPFKPEARLDAGASSDVDVEVEVEVEHKAGDTVTVKTTAEPKRVSNHPVTKPVDADGLNASDPGVAWAAPDVSAKGEGSRGETVAPEMVSFTARPDSVNWLVRQAGPNTPSSAETAQVPDSPAAPDAVAMHAPSRNAAPLPKATGQTQSLPSAGPEVSRGLTEVRDAPIQVEPAAAETANALAELPVAETQDANPSPVPELPAANMPNAKPAPVDLPRTDWSVPSPNRISEVLIVPVDGAVDLAAPRRPPEQNAPAVTRSTAKTETSGIAVAVSQGGNISVDVTEMTSLNPHPVAASPTQMTQAQMPEISDADVARPASNRSNQFAAHSSLPAEVWSKPSAQTVVSTATAMPVPVAENTELPKQSNVSDVKSVGNSVTNISLLSATPSQHVSGAPIEVGRVAQSPIEASGTVSAPLSENAQAAQPAAERIAQPEFVASDRFAPPRGENPRPEDGPRIAAPETRAPATEARAVVASATPIGASVPTAPQPATFPSVPAMPVEAVPTRLFEEPAYQITIQAASQSAPPPGTQTPVAPPPVAPPPAAAVITPLPIAQALDEERVFDFPPAELASATVTSDAPRATTPAPQPVALPRAVAAQLAEVARTVPDGPMELTLNPEELGKVRMSLSAMETSIAVALTIERPETAELMRRHLDMLEAEFRALGYEDVAFSFAGGDAQQRDGSGESKPPVTEDNDPAPSTVTPATVQISMGGGVDLRL